MHEGGNASSKLFCSRSGKAVMIGSRSIVAVVRTPANCMRVKLFGPSILEPGSPLIEGTYGKWQKLFATLVGLTSRDLNEE
jgi:hypothetical protein